MVDIFPARAHLGRKQRLADVHNGRQAVAPLQRRDAAVQIRHVAERRPAGGVNNRLIGGKGLPGGGGGKDGEGRVSQFRMGVDILLTAGNEIDFGSWNEAERAVDDRPPELVVGDASQEYDLVRMQSDRLLYAENQIPGEVRFVAVVVGDLPRNDERTGEVGEHGESQQKGASGKGESESDAEAGGGHG